MARSLAQLADNMNRAGIRYGLDETGEQLRVPIQDGIDVQVRWRRKQALVAITCATGVVVPQPLMGVALLAVARANDELALPGFTVDLDSRALEFRSRVLLGADGTLDVALFDREVTAALDAVNENLDGLVRVIDRSRPAMVAEQAVPFGGWAE